MYKYAVVNEKTNFVENIIVWDGKSNWKPPKGTYLVKTERPFNGCYYDKKKKCFNENKLLK